MSSPALDYARFAAGRYFPYDDGELLFEDSATGFGRAHYAIDFSSTADAASDPNRCRTVRYIGFIRLPNVTAGFGATGLGGLSTTHQLTLSTGDIGMGRGATVQQLTLSTGDSGAFGLSPIQQLIGPPAGVLIPVGGGVITVGITGSATPLVVSGIANAAFDGGIASAHVQPAHGLAADSSSPSLSRCLRALRLRRNLLTDTQTEALERQLEALLSGEDEPESPVVSESSLHRLIDFLSEHEALAHPSLSIMRSGYFATSWSPRRRAKLTIIFNPGGTADWIAIDLDATHPVHEKGSLPNLPDDFVTWMRA